jgi:hypothetical protein
MERLILLKKGGSSPTEALAATVLAHLRASAFTTRYGGQLSPVIERESKDMRSAFAKATADNLRVACQP